MTTCYCVRAACVGTRPEVLSASVLLASGLALSPESVKVGLTKEIQLICIKPSFWIHKHSKFAQMMNQLRGIFQRITHLTTGPGKLHQLARGQFSGVSRVSRVQTIDTRPAKVEHVGRWYPGEKIRKDIDIQVVGYARKTCSCLLRGRISTTIFFSMLKNKRKYNFTFFFFNKMSLERIGKKGIKQCTYFSQTSKNARILPTRVLTAVVWILLEVFTASARLGVWPWIPREGSVSVRYPDKQGSWGQRGAHLGPTGPRRAPCWPHELCYLGSQVQRGLVVTSVLKTKMICHVISNKTMISPA